jgi:NAD(P)-dependent dehydrogenase (short-subunit alcohol dehydrogenase family)
VEIDDGIVCLVTRAASGQGLATVQSLPEAGARIVIVTRPPRWREY